MLFSILLPYASISQYRIDCEMFHVNKSFKLPCCKNALISRNSGFFLSKSDTLDFETVPSVSDNLCIRLSEKLSSIKVYTWSKSFYFHFFQHIFFLLRC